MKANRAVRDYDDEAVSPVIAVILMVAITVVLAATVYVWVSGFGTSGSIKKFPQVTLKDDPTDDDTSGDFDAPAGALGILEHRGGDAINLADYTFKVFRNGAAVDVDAGTPGADDVAFKLDDQTCASAGAATGSFSVGKKLYVCTDFTSAWAANDELKVQVIDNNQNSIVYENTVIVT